MEKDDARYSTLEQLHERRKQVLRLHRKGYGVMQIVELSELSYPTVRAAIDRYEEGGLAAIRPATRGKRPEQLKLEFALWNRAAVMQLIEREYDIKLSVRGVGNYLSRWGFTPQKQIKKAYEQRLEAVQTWLNEQYPEIEKRAKAEGGEIHWGDETALVNTDVRGRSYAPSGKTRWMIIDEAFNSDKLIEFLEALVKDADKKVFLILDNLRVHHSKPVKAWAAERQDKIELFYLPSYSPELNPEERLNANLKHAIGTRMPVRTKTKLKLAATEYMVKLEQSPELVKSFFQDPSVKYTA